VRAIRPILMTTALCLPLVLGGCEFKTFQETGALGFILRFFSGQIPFKNSVQKRKQGKEKHAADVAFTGKIGGLSGTYDLDLADYGNIQGTADIKGSFKAKVREDNNPSAYAVIEAAVLDRMGYEIELTLAKVKYNGRQTAGGVKAVYNLRIKFEGTVTAGERKGQVVKGKMKLKGNFKKSDTP